MSSARRLLTVGVLAPTLALAACTQGAVIEVTNDTACEFKDVTGYRTNPRTNEREVIFQLYQIEPGATRPAYFMVTWEGPLEIVSERPPFFSGQAEITRGTERFTFAMAGDAPLKCLEGEGR